MEKVKDLDETVAIGELERRSRKLEDRLNATGEFLAAKFPRKRHPKDDKENSPEWKRLVKVVPDLAELLAEARAIRDDDPTRAVFCANSYWYGDGRLKEEVSQLVGWGASKDQPEATYIRSSEAYTLASDVIYGALPGCRNCACL